MDDEIVMARDITDCDECPLYENDCPGGWASGAGGVPIEPPCCSWNDDTEVYEGMYDRSPSEAEIRWAEELWEQKEIERKEKEHKQYIETLRQKVWNLTGDDYRHVEFRRNGSIVDDWLCPYCHTWQRPDSESMYDGIVEAWCSRCNRRIVYCSELEREDYE